jgi:hypothetical protein
MEVEMKQEHTAPRRRSIRLHTGHRFERGDAAGGGAQRLDAVAIRMFDGERAETQTVSFELITPEIYQVKSTLMSKDTSRQQTSVCNHMLTRPAQSQDLN